MAVLLEHADTQRNTPLDGDSGVCGDLQLKLTGAAAAAARSALPSAKAGELADMEAQPLVSSKGGKLRRELLARTGSHDLDADGSLGMPNASPLASPAIARIPSTPRS